MSRASNSRLQWISTCAQDISRKLNSTISYHTNVYGNDCARVISPQADIRLDPDEDPAILWAYRSDVDSVHDQVSDSLGNDDIPDEGAYYEISGEHDDDRLI